MTRLACPCGTPHRTQRVLLTLCKQSDYAPHMQETQRDLMTRAEVAELLPASIPTLVRWARKGIGPQPIKVGPRMVRYRRADVDAFLRGA